ncbi:hypothetical protein AKJ16_DCAP07957 [Drosera capensis]
MVQYFNIYEEINLISPPFQLDLLPLIAPQNSHLYKTTLFIESHRFGAQLTQKVKPSIRCSELIACNLLTTNGIGCHLWATLQWEVNSGSMLSRSSWRVGVQTDRKDNR